MASSMYFGIGACAVGMECLNKSKNLTRHGLIHNIISAGLSHRDDHFICSLPANMLVYDTSDNMLSFFRLLSM